ncbi:MAG TPA: LytTR family DNA-binding domain-containing protein [Bacteroidales bacterium]
MISCIAIDDEPLALRQIAGYIEKTPFLELAATFESALEALNFLNNNRIDLMFVDIQMPDLSGMDLVKSLDEKPEIIFTTAFSEYAVEGFKVDALDYLLKPLDYASFLKAANKAQSHFERMKIGSEELNTNANHLFIKSDYKIIRLELDKILYIEGMREYVRIHLENAKPVMTLISMKKIEQKLPSSHFMRVHRSFIVNLDKITTIEKSRIIFDKEYIPVSEQYKEAFQKFIDEQFLS